MISDFSITNNNGVKVYVDFKNHPDIFKDVDPATYNSLHDGSKKGIGWTYDGKEINLSDKNVSIQGFPTIDFNYVVAVYLGLDGEFTPPRNAVIYHADGSIHKILGIPPFISEKLIKRLQFLKQENPPLSWAEHEGELCFGGFGWDKKDDGKLVNFISVLMERESYEQKELDPQTGSFGECLGSGLAMYARY